MRKKKILTADAPGSAVRTRILDAALKLVRSDGGDAATTRAVAKAAAVKVPTIYRLFGDKQGLLDAVVAHGIDTYVVSKADRATSPNPDPVEELRRSWDTHVAFGLANPALFAMMSNNPRSPAAAQGLRIFKQRIHAVAVAGRLTTTEERAIAMVRSCCVGFVQMTIADDRSDVAANSRAIREAIFRTITTPVTDEVPRNRETAAATLRATLDQPSDLTRGEKALLDEILERLSK